MQVTSHDAKTRLSKLIAAAERGEEVAIARRDKPVVRLALVPDFHGDARVSENAVAVIDGNLPVSPSTASSWGIAILLANNGFDFETDDDWHQIYPEDFARVWWAFRDPSAPAKSKLKFELGRSDHSRCCGVQCGIPNLCAAECSASWVTACRETPCSSAALRQSSYSGVARSPPLGRWAILTWIGP